MLHCLAWVYWTTKYRQRSNDVPLQYTLDAMLWLSRAFNFNLLPPNEHTFRRWFLTWLMITSCFICHYIETHCIPETVKIRAASNRDKKQTPFDSMYRSLNYVFWIQLIWTLVHFNKQVNFVYLLPTESETKGRGLRDACSDFIFWSWAENAWQNGVPLIRSRQQEHFKYLEF